MHIYQIHATPLLSTSVHAAFPHLRQSHPRLRRLIPLPLPPRPPWLHLPHRPLLHVPLSLTPPPPPKRDLGPLLCQLAITIGGRAEVGDEHGRVPTGGGFRRRHSHLENFTAQPPGLLAGMCIVIRGVRKGIAGIKSNCQHWNCNCHF